MGWSRERLMEQLPTLRFPYHSSQGPGGEEAGSVSGGRMRLEQLDDRKAAVTLHA